LNFKKINVSAFLGRRRQQWSALSSSSAALKSLSDGMLVGGGMPGISVRVLTTEETCAVCMFMFYQEAGSSLRLMSGSDKN